MKAQAAFQQCVRTQGRRFVVLWSLVIGIAACVMVAWPALSESPPGLTADDVARQFCAVPPMQAQVGPDAVPNEELRVQVPDENASPLDAPAVHVRLGDIVKFTVISDRAGAAGVHGLSTIEAVHSGQAVAIQFRAVYSGRFPLHFHGTDGSHFEMMAINISAEAGGSPIN